MTTAVASWRGEGDHLITHTLAPQTNDRSVEGVEEEGGGVAVRRQLLSDVDRVDRG